MVQRADVYEDCRGGLTIIACVDGAPVWIGSYFRTDGSTLEKEVEHAAADYLSIIDDTDDPSEWGTTGVIKITDLAECIHIACSDTSVFDGTERTAGINIDECGVAGIAFADALRSLMG